MLCFSATSFFDLTVLSHLSHTFINLFGIACIFVFFVSRNHKEKYGNYIKNIGAKKAKKHVLNIELCNLETKEKERKNNII